jgi:hypothetical protein
MTTGGSSFSWNGIYQEEIARSAPEVSQMATSRAFGGAKGPLRKFADVGPPLRVTRSTDRAKPL